MTHRTRTTARSVLLLASVSLLGCVGGAGAEAVAAASTSSMGTDDGMFEATDTGGGEGSSGSDSGADVVPCAAVLGLYVDDACGVLSDGVLSFTPQYPLWSDGVAKERYAFIPPGSSIDVGDPNAWVFPVGTRFWKHFATADGRRLETRVLEKTADLKGVSGWTFETYAWNEAGDDVTRVIDGRRDVWGTEHDIPAESDCAECHSGGENDWDATLKQDALLDLALGFGAIQLNHDGSETTLESLAADGWLDGTVTAADAVVPGDATARAALGYLHANCGSCHGGAKPAKRLTMLVPVGASRVEDTPTYQGTVGVPTDPNEQATGIEEMPATRIAPGEPENSALLWRMLQRGGGDAPMPPLATDQVDDAGVQAVSAWIEDLQ